MATCELGHLLDIDVQDKNAVTKRHLMNSWTLGRLDLTTQRPPSVQVSKNHKLDQENGICMPDFLLDMVVQDRPRNVQAGALKMRLTKREERTFFLASSQAFDLVIEFRVMTRRTLREYLPEMSSMLFERVLRDLKDSGEIKFNDTHVWLIEETPPLSGFASYRNTETRAQVWDQTGGKCWYCRKQTNPFRDFHVDHAIPQSRGGSDEIENLRPSCQSCNLEKGAQTSCEYLRSKGLARWPFEEPLFHD